MELTLDCLCDSHVASFSSVTRETCIVHVVMSQSSYRAVQSYGVVEDVISTNVMHSFIHSLVFSLEGWAWQEPEPSDVTGMAVAHCILGKFLGVVCHCFPPPLDVPILAARCLCPQRRERS